MRLLLLGPYRQKMSAYLMSLGDEVLTWEAPLHGDSSCLEGKDFLISYGYRHIIKKEVLEKFPQRAVNLHISLLPWNRGADPNLWSFLENTPKGVTIHYIDRGIDTGDILVQKTIGFAETDSLRTSYERLTREIENLFMQVWPDLRLGKLKGKPQPPGGSLHFKRDRIVFEYLLTSGWDTPVINLIGIALR